MTKIVDTSTNPVVAQLLGSGEPPLDVGLLCGYFGPSKKENQTRLYTSLDFRTYYEFPIAAVVSTMPIDPKDPHSPTRVMVKGATSVDFVQIQTAEARFFSGPIADRNLARTNDKGDFCREILAFAVCNTAGHHCTNANTACPT